MRRRRLSYAGGSGGRGANRALFAAHAAAALATNTIVSGVARYTNTTFTVADLNLASICSWSKPIKFDFGPFPNADAWLDRCLARPAYKAARGNK